MPLMLHLTDARDAPGIRAAGLRGSPASFPGPHARVELERAVFAVPVLPRGASSHLWTSELVRRGVPAIVAVHFEIEPAAPVWVGREYETHERLALCEAVKRMLSAHDLRGWEVVIPGDVPAVAIREVRGVAGPLLPLSARLRGCEQGSHPPERLSPSVDTGLPT